MNRVFRTFVAAVVLGVVLLPSAYAQEQKQAQAQAEQQETTMSVPARLTVVFSEMEGERKTSSIPYTFLTVLYAQSARVATLRAGVNVPVRSGTSYAYQDVGTNIDINGRHSHEGRFFFNLVLERTWFEESASQQAVSERPVPPVIRRFKWQGDLLMRDGQTLQSIASTDPVSGRVIRVDVTFNVLK